MKPQTSLRPRACEAVSNPALRFWIASSLMLLAMTLWTKQVYAQPFGLAMHGEAKYKAESTYLDYVNPDAPIGGHLKQAAIGTFDTLNPFTIKGTSARGLNLYYDRLMARVWDEPFTMYPLIAERYEMPEDRSEITFHLNPRAIFNDGSSITADDVLFSFETLKEHGRPNMRQVYKLVNKAEKKGEHAVRFVFGEGYDRETAMILTLMPVLSQAYWSDKEFNSTTLEPPVSSGPYEIAAVDPGRSITYKRRIDYWAKDLLTNTGHHNFETITYDYYRDDTVAQEAFMAGDITLRVEQNLARWRDAYNTSDPKLVKDEIAHQRPEPARGMIFNTRRAPFDDIQVRRALKMLSDFDKLNTLYFDGVYKLIESYFPNSELASKRVSRSLLYRDARSDMWLANEFLEKSGWVVKDGKRTKNGETFSFELLLKKPEDEKIALGFQRKLKRMGIEMRIRTLDSSAFTNRIRNYDYDMVIHEWRSSLSPGTEQALYWGCAAAEQPGRFNYAGICDPKIDELTARVATTKDRKALVGAIHSLDSKLLSGHYMIPLYYRGYDHYAYWKPIKRPETTPLYGAVLETWWMDSLNP